MLAPKHFSTLFIRVFVENVPWLVEKLGVRVLPCVICFVDGVSTDKYGRPFIARSLWDLTRPPQNHRLRGAGEH